MSVGASSTIPNNSGLRPSDFWGTDTPYDSSTTLPLSSAKKTPIVNSNVTTTSVRSTGSNRQLYKSHQPYDFSSLTTPNSIRYSNTRGSSDPRNYYHRKSAEPPNPSFTYPTTTPAAIHSSAHSSNTSSATSTKSIPLSSKPLTDPKENRRLFYPPNHSHLRTSSSSSQSLSTLNSIRALVSDLDLEFRSELNSKNDQIKALKDQLDSLNAQLADQRDVFRKHADSLVLVDQMKQQVASLEFQLDQIKSFDPSLSSPHSHEFFSCLNSLLNTNSNNVHDLLEMLTVPNILASKNSPSAGDYHRIIENLSNLVSLVVKDNVQMKDSLSLLQLNRQNLNQALKICLDEKYIEDGTGNAQLDDSQANGVGSPKNISTSRNGQSNSGNANANANANAFASKSSERWLEKLDQLVSSFVSSNTSDANVGTNPATINNAIEQDNTSNDNDDIGTNSASRKKLKSALVNLVNIIDS
ncbi:hypothetical protein AX774_g4650 [Zancudomyces culisetae]|uniref:Uncharacterized protein n=1 Tax=Zancudomyces culisetae TaxID=1213189 RepID=A0A1R1PLP0_ZANCU|nr:hypothetical protein AX774_g4650 [Zancudomyces culisetae]|eukprot:OMH81876.1 hypothetical protein AX774_g4650 [Zancudomyces culisetae]